VAFLDNVGSQYFDWLAAAQSCHRKIAKP